jgi:hypothetical protein
MEVHFIKRISNRASTVRGGDGDAPMLFQWLCGRWSEVNRQVRMVENKT